MYTQHTSNLGYFKEKEFKQEFTYRFTKNEWALSKGFTHEFDVIDGGVMFGTVKKTRVIVCTDEDTNGDAVTETWICKVVEFPK